jgi:N-acetylmuramoyl-L-alanine amidase
MSKEKWELIQAWAGAGIDGKPGNETADKIIAKAGIQTPAPAKPATGSLVTGKGKNISRIILHCAATREGQDFSASTIRGWHTAPKPRGRGWKDIGYHFIIRLDGTIEKGREENVTGAHAAPWNTGSIGVCYIGGVKIDGQTPKDTRTPEQLAAMERLVRELLKAYPGADVLGHRDVPGVAKACPSFDVRAWWKSVQ